MKKKSFVALLAAFALTATGALTSCSPTNTNLGDYVYNTYISTNPKTWNTHNWETSDESYITSFTEMGLYDTILNSKKDGYEIVTEMAAEMPIEVDYTDIDEETLSKYYSGNPGENMIWDIKLNKDAKWEDGTAITADDYVKSMQLQLDPNYANYRADSYYKNNLVIANAEEYFKAGRSTIESAYSYVDQTTGKFKDPSSQCADGVYYLNIAKECGFVSNIFSSSSSDSSTSNSLYTLFQQTMITSNEANNKAANRIVDAVKQFLLAGYKSDTYYTEHQGYYDNHKSDWEKAKDEGLSSITKDMLEDHPDIDFSEFDSNEIYVRVDGSQSVSDTNKERYSKAALITDLTTVATGLGRYGASSSAKSWAYKLLSFVSVHNNNTADWSKVGLVKVDDYTIRFYLSKAIDELNLKFALSSNWLVKTDLYEKLTTTQASGSKQTSYATNSINNYMSYGPYKLSKYESGKTINLVRNENWYGWNDGKHVGQYQMTGLNTQIITDHNTALTLFKQGQLDDIDLTADDMKEFGTSGRLTTVYESYTTKISFNSNRSKLLYRQKQSNDGNKTILANKDFREGLSLAINRKDFASQATSGSKAFTGLLNDLYLSDVSTGEAYRNTTQGKSVYNMVYGNLGGTEIGEETPLSESAYGNNATLAAKYVAKAFNDEFNSEQDGHLEKDSKINIEFRVYDNTAANTVSARTQLEKYFKEVVSQANSICGSSVSIEINTTKDENYYDSAKQGNYDMIFSIWGGAQIDPFGLMEVYCSSDFASCCEYGFKGQQNKTSLSIDYNGNGVIDDGETQSFEAWYTQMKNLSSSQQDKKLTILAGLEAGILSRFEAIPLVARGTSSLTSFKVENGSSNYVSLVGYGGIRFMTFNYTNSDWSKFVSSNNGDLTSLYKNAEE